ncbi:circularly permuted type 2 ATP-grasp protein [Gemmobacter fulvus]|uniref:circularly permuted type 2 ATP-grasp protein n=1 Tax=Gemmobacter fulvus TaxID=2840474 RepID=UPI0027969AEC|nr:circularly permuted type 2 ATP-grasp protein [Gemmobacter fulvus]MDQ1848651.1 circularly permuted type 2 ATP-grasp protein [Gemmobacter fulvus]
MSVAAASASLPALLARYAPQPGVADELFDRDGRMRPVWVPFITQLAALSPDEVAARFARGNQYLRDAGVYFRQYSRGPTQERDWPLSHVPVLMAEAEWDGICGGLAQRADLLERVMADLYGPATLVRDGHLPASLVARNPQWLRPLVGVQPRSGHFLHHIAFEIGRSPDGSWFVLGDRTQAPSGSGFALENRMATTRIFSDPFPRANVRRLAGFFRAFREAMVGLSGESGRRMAMLTPGPNNDTYYEHTYIARYLGLTLLEGEDLILRDGEAMVRTVRGLEPLGLLWRRIDSEFADPLELNEGSQIGTPGLIEALRGGSLTLINALGTGVLEARAMMAFLPKIAQVLLGEPLKMPNIATWWCGQQAERAYVEANAARMMIGRALDYDLPFAMGAETAMGHITPAAPDHAAFVGQEAVTLSTTPVWHEGHLVPRPMTVRVFAARTESGWTFMPGGYARIGLSPDVTALAMQAGGSVADVWVVAAKPVPQDSLVVQGSFERAPPGILPSRAADNLYWLGRYVERTEGAIRLLRAYHLRLAETDDAQDPRLIELAGFLAGLGMPLEDRAVPEALMGLIWAAQGSAAKVRDRFSPDGWGALADMAKSAQKLSDKVAAGADAAHAMSILLRKISGFSGLVHENMYHFAGWRFLSLGRAQERADGLLLMLATFADADAAPGALDIAIEVGDSVMTHQRRYRFGPSRDTVLDLLVLDENNPRAVLYQIAAMRDHLDKLPQAGRGGRLTPLERALLTLDTELRVAGPSDLGTDQIAALRLRLGEVFDLLTATYLR